MAFYGDSVYYERTLKIALPIMLQQLLMSSLTLVSGVMIGQLGEVSMAVNHLTGQVFFLLNLALYGVGSGAAIFVAQLWGKRDVANIRRVLGLALKLGLAGALVFWALAIFAPEQVLGFYTTDPAVIRVGSEFLRVFGWSYPLFAVTFAYATVLRSTGQVRLPLVVTFVTLGLNVALAYPLIFGLFGLPALGVMGVAVAGLIARVVECLALLFAIYYRWNGEENPAAARLRELLAFDPAFVVAVMKPVLPVIANEVLWSFGITAYNTIYGRIGTEAVAVISIVGTIDQLAFVAFLGLGSATAVIVGNLIGEGENEKAYEYAGRSLSLQIMVGLLLGALVDAAGGLVFRLYDVSPQVIESARLTLLVMCLGMWVRASNHVIIIGILRSGGDTMFSLILDGLVIWLVGVPLTALGAFVLGWPIHLVYMLTLSEEVVKFVIGTWRYFTRRWINRLTEALA